jgi:hypothetical protein
VAQKDMVKQARNPSEPCIKVAMDGSATGAVGTGGDHKILVSVQTFADRMIRFLLKSDYDPVGSPIQLDDHEPVYWFLT